MPRRWQRKQPDALHSLWRVQGEPTETFEALLASGHGELYDLLEDPDETVNLAADNPHLIKEYKDLLREIVTRSVVQQSGYATAEEEAMIEKHLRALGYLAER